MYITKRPVISFQKACECFDEMTGLWVNISTVDTRKHNLHEDYWPGCSSDIQAENMCMRTGPGIVQKQSRHLAESNQ